jgi:hypothetical protein
VDRGRATVPHLRALPDFVQIACFEPALNVPGIRVKMIPTDERAEWVACRGTAGASGNPPAKAPFFLHLLTLVGFPAQANQNRLTRINSTKHIRGIG